MIDVLTLRGINSGYGTIQVLFNISVDAKKEDVTVIVGPNGAGKTTLFKTVLGLVNVYSGEISFNGHSLVGMPTNKIVRLGVSYIPQREGFFEKLTVKENLKIGGYLLERGEFDERLEEVLKIFPVLGRRDYINKKASKLSGGERKMLTIAMGLMRKPMLLLLDEPTGGLMPKLAMDIFDKIKEIHTTGTQVIMTEEKADIALENGDRAFLLVNGQIQSQGNAKDMLVDPDLRKKYFGLA